MAGLEVSQLLQRLPQELFYEVYNLGFTVPPTNRVVVTRTFALPAASRVDKASRKQFLNSFFRNSTFVFTDAVEHYWFKSLRRVNFEKINRIEILATCANPDLYLFKTPLQAKQWRLNSFVDIINIRKIFPSYLFGGGIPTDPLDFTFFRGAKTFLGRGDFHSRWVVKDWAEGTAFTKASGGL